MAPYGLLTRLRQYLAARPDDDRTGPVRLYVVENIRAAKVSKDAFERDPTFNLQAFANRAFGVFQNEEEFGEVVWRFSAKAAAHGRLNRERAALWADVEVALNEGMLARVS